MKKQILMLLVFLAAVIAPAIAQQSTVQSDASSASISKPNAGTNPALVFLMGKPKDQDGDGVKDKNDNCPDTPKDVKVDLKGCSLDGDKDGVADYLDKCPGAVGLKNLNGCPDKDKDGVADNDDNCSEVPGLARFAGCPDSDDDGIEDSKDKCPNAKGPDQFKGCPDTDNDGVEDSQDKCPDTKKGIKVNLTGCAADTDGDGIIDSEDKCPTTKAEGSPNGCPIVKPEVKKRLQFAARGINFESGKAILKTSSYAMLDEVVSILREYTDYNLQISGHTDNVGEDQMNFDLSKARVDAVKEYLLSKGLPDSRIDVTGFGESKPISTNGTSEGRAQNRRVELELFLK